MLTAPEFAHLVQTLGQPMTWQQGKPPHDSASITVIVQSTAKAQEAIVNAFGVNGVSIQLKVDSIPIPPEKFDIFTDANGHRYVIDTVVKHESRGSGALVSFTCYSKGK
jgi:hypothetical protein